MPEIRVPELAESISEASIAQWNVADGDLVSTGMIVASIETDKVVLEVPAPADGVIGNILKKQGEEVTSGELLASITETQADQEEPAEAASHGQATTAIASARTEDTLEKTVLELAESFSAEPPAQAVSRADDARTPRTVAAGHASRSAAEAQAEQRDDRKREDERAAALPAARKLAAEKEIDISSVPGTGRGGRITVDNVRSAADARDSMSSQSGPAHETRSRRPSRREKMSFLRSRIAQRMIESQQRTASLSTFNEVDMSAVIALRKKHGAQFEQVHGVRLGLMSFFVKSACSALVSRPVINASVEGDEVIYNDFCDVGIAVAAPRGLVVPVLRSAEQMGMPAIEKAIADFGRRAQLGSLGMEDLTGGTFTITNGGVFGSMLSTPIINPPQSAILGVHATKQRPMVIDDQIVARPVCYLAVTYDHRIIDGRDAVLFLAAVKDALEDPARLLLELN